MLSGCERHGIGRGLTLAWSVYTDRDNSRRGQEQSSNAAALRSLIGCPGTVDAIPAWSMRIHLDEVALRMREIITPMLAPERDLIGNRDNVGAMPVAPPAECHAAAPEIVKHHRVEALKAEIAARQIDHSAHANRQAP